MIRTLGKNLIALILFGCAWQMIPAAHRGIQAQSTSSQAAPAADAGRGPRRAEEFDALFKQLSNWGRWGAADQLGAANLVTADKRRQAAKLVRAGESVSLAHTALTERAADNQSPFVHTMQE